MNNIHISVIVPFYNAEKYIEQCIVALLDQDDSVEQYEIILVDNGSTDSSPNIVRRYPRIKLISEQKRGSYAARNSGLKEAKGDIIAFTDADCVPAADWLKQIEIALDNSETGIALGTYQFARESFLLNMMEDYENEKNKYVFTSGVKELYFGYTRNMAVRKILFDELGTFDERFRGSDTIFIQRCVDRFSCNIVKFSPQMSIRHLEIDSTNKYYKKLFIYGVSSRKYGQVVNVKSLTNWQRFMVFRDTTRNRGYSWFKTVIFFCLLLAGFFYWIMGRASNT